MAFQKIVHGQPTSDGAGVRLTRMIGTPELDMIDPFLMLDRFDNDDPGAYIGGFPDHPHRGFETVTIMVDGRMRHRDSTGGEGIIGPGDVQWMTAGRGIVHSEMPEQIAGRMRGFQLWLNLPAEQKMSPAGYQDILKTQIPVRDIEGCEVRVIAGVYSDPSGHDTTGPAQSHTPVRLLSVSLRPGASFDLTPEPEHNAFVCVYEGALSDKDATVTAPALSLIDTELPMHLTACADGVEFLYGEGAPLNEPVARYGPFVMNTREQLEQAIYDFNNGQFGQI